MRRFISFLAGLSRFATLAVALMLACLAPQAEALLTPSHPGLSEPIPSQAHAPESILIIEEIHPVGYADDGECLDLCICVEPETLTRVFCIVKSPTGLEVKFYTWKDPDSGVMRYGSADSYDVYYLGVDRAVIDQEIVSWDRIDGVPAGDRAVSLWGGDSIRMRYGNEAASGASALYSFMPTAVIGGSTTIPGVGEAQDWFIMTSENSSPFDIVCSFGSLCFSTVTFGFSPNFGGPVKTGTRTLTESADAVGDSLTSFTRLSPDDFVHVTPTRFADTILEQGLDPTISGYVTKWKYIEDVTDPSVFNTMLYRQNLWTSTVGKFDDGAAILKIDKPNPKYISPRTNWKNGIPQWRFEEFIDPSKIERMR